MVRRQSRLLTTYYVLADVDARHERLRAGLRASVRVRPHPHHEGTAPLLAVRDAPAVHRRCSFRSRFRRRGSIASRRGRSRVDDFFAVFVGTIVAVVVGQFGTLYVQTYFASDAARDRGAYEVSQYVWALFLVLNVALAYGSRAIVRGALERRWRAGVGIKRVLIVGRRRSRAARRRQDPRACRARAIASSDS